MATINGGEGGNVVTGTAADDVIYGHSIADTLPSVGQIAATLVATGLATPVFATSAPGDAGRLYVVEKDSGQIMLLDPSSGARSTFLSIPTSELSTGGEQGLLSVAFHPDYQSNGKFYVNLVNANGDVEVRTYTRSAGNPDVADSTGSTVITIPHPTFTNHNGGTLAFGPDGMLYVSIGDGGGGGDPGENAQNLTSLLGKILRLDVNSDAFPGDSTRNYAIPSDNPFVNQFGADEIWAYGLRNPWRLSFDSATGDLYIGDVGQSAREEIDFQAAGSAGGLNYGWDTREGTLPFEGPNIPSFVDPIFEYDRTAGQCVTGGYVYRGPSPGMQGAYIFADFLSDRVWSLRVENGQAVDVIERTGQITTGGAPLSLIASFGVDGNGTLYAISWAGDIYRLDPSAAAGDGNDVLSGGAGNDTIAGGVGNDILWGGTGSDAALYPIASTSASWSRNTDGSWTVTAGASGIDTLREIEALRFTDRDVLLNDFSLNGLAGDFNGDGLSDILLRNSGSGMIWEYLMVGTTVAGQGQAATVTLDWRVSGIGDFNNDGRSDILLHNQSTGTIWEYQMNGMAVSGQGSVATVGTGWQIAGIGDFNADNRDDVLLHNVDTGLVWEYQMNGIAVSGQGGVAALPAGWLIAGVADFNGDLRDDILLYHQNTGLIWEYQMNGTTVAAQGAVAAIGTSWQVRGLGDFNNDGRSDILLYNSTTGMIWQYQMNGTAVSGQGPVATVGLDWQINEIGDFNGDGRDDIVLRNNNTGLLWEYQMHGTAVSGQGQVTTVGLDWHLL